MRRTLEVDGEKIAIWLASTGGAHVVHCDDGRELPCRLLPGPGRGGHVLELGGQSYPLRLAVGEDATFVHLDGRTWRVGRTDLAQTLGGAADGAALDVLAAPMPGVVISVAVAPWQEVAEGQPLMVIESMKLETTLTARRAGVVAEVPFVRGDAFDSRVVLVRMEPRKEGM
jgi:acetyl/propionyl-CoA carboxylase alpha subunit